MWRKQTIMYTSFLLASTMTGLACSPQESRGLKDAASGVSRAGDFPSDPATFVRLVNDERIPKKCGDAIFSKRERRGRGHILPTLPGWLDNVHAP